MPKKARPRRPSKPYRLPNRVPVLKVMIRPDDIKAGQRNDICNCPVAVAIRRITKRSVSVLGDSCLFYHVKGKTVEHLSLPLPVRIQKFIERFDAGEKVKPTQFLFRDQRLDMLTKWPERKPYKRRKQAVVDDEAESKKSRPKRKADKLKPSS